MKNNRFDEVYKLRKEAGRKSLLAFARLYLPHHLKCKPSQAHVDIYKMLEDLLVHRGQRVAIAAPRLFGKSTMITLIYILYCICYEKEKLIVIFSETSQMAQNILRNVKHEILDNKALKTDFPEICEMQNPKPPRWTQSALETRNNITVTALGLDQGVRGLRHKEHRPTLVIADDLESAKTVVNKDVREKRKDWFEKVVLFLGSEITNYLLLGTVYHPFSLLAEYLKEKDKWRPFFCKAILSEAKDQDLWQECLEIKNNRKQYCDQTGMKAAKSFYAKHKAEMDKGAITLWPDKWRYFDLYMMREDNPISFASEMMNTPIDSRTSLIPRDIIYFWSDDYPTEEALLKFIGNDVSFTLSCDPSMGLAATKGDYSAIIVLASDLKTGVCYVIVADIKRRPIEELIETILSYASRYHLTKCVVESNNFQAMVIKQLMDEANKQNIFLPITEVKNSSDKLGRIQSLRADITNKRLQFARKHVLLLDQLCSSPNHKHDDGPDALEMGYRETRDGGKLYFRIFGGPRDDRWRDDYREHFGLSM